MTYRKGKRKSKAYWGVPMFGDKLMQLVDQGVAVLDQDIKLIELLLEATRDARGHFDVMRLEGSTHVRLAQEDQGSPPPTGHGLVGRPAPTKRPFGPGDRARFESALAAAGMSSASAIIDMATVLAIANAGLVQTREAASVLIGMGLSESSLVNLAGYLGRRMRESDQYERVGKKGSGVYKWLPFEEWAPGDGVPIGEDGDDISALLEPSDDEVSGGRISSEVEEHSVV